MCSTQQFFTLAAGLLCLKSTIAFPAPETRPIIEVIPGESLPSLASLGWNSTYINSLPDPVFSSDKRSMLTRANDPRCGDNYANVNDAIVCYKFLNALDTYPCTVPSGQRSGVFAYAGNARVEGYGIGASSYCRDVASAVLWSIDHCTRPQQDVAGWAVAYGNGDFWIRTGS